MPRIRSVKPDFFTDSDLCELPPLHRLLFEGLWCHSDREGRLEDKPREIKVKVLPFDACDIDAMLDDLAKAKQGRGFIVRYEGDGKRLIECRNFPKHQKIHRDEKASAFPPPPKHPGSREIALQTPSEPGNREAKVPVSCLLSLGDGLLSPVSQPPPEKPGEEFEVWNRWQDIRGEHALPKEGAIPEGFGYWYAKTSDHWGAIALEEAFCLYCADPWSTAEGLQGKNRDGSVRLFMSDQVNLERLLEAEKRRAHG